MSDPDDFGALRADWLKLRGCLFDPVTRLPSLPAVLDDVRRRLEDGEAVALLYLDLSGGGEGEPLCGWQVQDRLIHRVARTLEHFRDRDLGARDLVAQVGVRSDELVLFAGLDGGPVVFEEMHRRLVAEVQRALDDEIDGVTHHAPTLESAWVGLGVEPRVRIERSIYASLALARERCRREGERRQSRRLRVLRRMLASEEVTVRYQPIVELDSGAVHGFEALCSAPTAETFETAETLFAFAEENAHGADLDRLCHRRALEHAHRLPARGKLFLNCSVHAFADPRLVGELSSAAAAAGLAAADVVLEVTERVAITEPRDFRRGLDAVRAAGFRLAIDDMGSGYSSLHAVGEIEPDYLKFDATLVHRLHESAIKRDLFGALVHLAERLGARAIAEGIELAEELDTARALGVDLGQGFLFARPARPEHLGPVHVPLTRAG